LSYAYWSLNLEFKSHKKYIEKEIHQITSRLTNLKKVGSTKGANNVIEELGTLIKRLEDIKQRVTLILEINIRLCNSILKW
jgi:hypothetical protein